MENKYLKKRKWVVIGAVLLVLTLTLGAAYSLWSYFKVGKNQELVAGEIYMKYREGTSSINITNAMPTSTYDPSQVFEFTIEGKNTYTKPIWYEILINWGGEPENRHTRIPDEFLRFRLTEQLPGGEETEVIKEGKYEDFSKGTKIWVNKIAARQTDEIKITYKLYMWVSSEMHLGAGDDASSSDMDMNTWNTDAFASVKVEVNGDFEEKEIDIDIDEEEGATPVSCFEYKVIDKTYLYNEERTDNEIQLCSAYFEENYSWDFNEEHTASAYCDGTGSNRNGDKLEDNIYNNLNETDRQELSEIGILKTIPRTPEVIITDYNRDYEEEVCGSDVVIPSKIEGHKVVYIDNSHDDEALFLDDNSGDSVVLPIAYVKPKGGPFVNKGLTSLVLPNTIEKIGYLAFAYNALTRVVIPDSVTTIGNYAFLENPLEEVEVGKGIMYLGDRVFSNWDKGSSGRFDYEPTFKKLKVHKTCEEMKKITTYAKSGEMYYPWTDSKAIHSDGLTVYGYENNEEKLCETINQS